MGLSPAPLQDTLRQPGLNEKRCIIRHGLRYYHGIVVAGIYKVSGSVFDTDCDDEENITSRLAIPLSECIAKHPFLSAVIQGEDTETPIFRRSSSVDLAQHIKVLKVSQFSTDLAGDKKRLDQRAIESDLIDQSLEYIVHDEFNEVDKIPPWRVYAMILPANDERTVPKGPTPTTARILIAYSFSHSHGDGTSALIFHRTFLKAFRRSLSNTQKRTQTRISTQDKALPPAIDSPVPLPISWTYLLSALLKEIKPTSFLPRLLTPSAWSSTPAPPAPWSGSPHFFESKLPTTAVRTIAIPHTTLQLVLARARANQAKLTGVLHQLITTALCQTLQTHRIKSTYLLASTPVDLRRAKGTRADEMGVMASAVALGFAPTPLTPSGDGAQSFWHAAGVTGLALVNGSASLWDQPIGLLRYLASLRAWHVDKIGKQRDAAYELSNIMTFDDQIDDSRVVVEKMVYAQGADVSGPALAFNVVSVAGADLVMVVSWQVGALGVTGSAQGVESGERLFVDEMVGRIELGFEVLSRFHL